MPTDDERPEPGGDPSEATPPARPEGPEEAPHEDTGLDLARSIARSLAGSKRAASRQNQRRGPARPGRRFPRSDAKTSGAHPDERDPQLLDNTIGRLIASGRWRNRL